MREPWTSHQCTYYLNRYQKFRPRFASYALAQTKFMTVTSSCRHKLLEAALYISSPLQLPDIIPFGCQYLCCPQQIPRWDSSVCSQPMIYAQNVRSAVFTLWLLEGQTQMGGVHLCNRIGFRPSPLPKYDKPSRVLSVYAERGTSLHAMNF